MYKVLLALTLSSLVSIGSTVCVPIGTLIGTAGLWKAYYEHHHLKAQKSASWPAYINSYDCSRQLLDHQSQGEIALGGTLATGLITTCVFCISTLIDSPRTAFRVNRAARFLGRATIGGGTYVSFLIAPCYLNKLRKQYSIF